MSHVFEVTDDAYKAIEAVAAHDPDQAWLLTEEWQAGERQADADIAAGRVTRYQSDEEFLRSLGATDDFLRTLDHDDADADV